MLKQSPPSRSCRGAMWTCPLIFLLCLHHICLATDVASPLNLQAPYNPYIALWQTGDGTNPAHTWFVRSNHNEYFIQDSSTGFNVFRTRTGAPTDSLVVDAAGNLGFGTLFPARKLHALSSNTPTLRLEQTFGVFPSQVYDIGQNANGFFVTDVSWGTIPFFIKPTAPTDSLFIDSTGTIGLGTSSPAAGLHLKKLAQPATAEIMARFETTDDPIGGLFISNNSAGDGLFVPKLTGRSASQNAALVNEAIISLDVGASPAIVYNAAKGAGGPLVTRPLVVYRNNGVAKVTIAANGDVLATSFNPVSSRALKHDIKNLDSKMALEAIHQLTPVEFVYNDDESNEKRVGFIAEDVPEVVAAADRKSVPIMDVVALLTRVVKDQQLTIEEQRKNHNEEVEGMRKRLDAMERRLAATK